ncbi:gluconokinase [Ramlibacter sp. GTP1]|uniref:Gluconokinase n=2 Tax=Ramlibacter albus TaxID=2079448 RepID=A0A923S3P1_9BURK|nr:gluconokinase [Ramlibacter albus]MBC5766043.1 gluconokinase [Ramlibacter albus]
MGVSGCGKSSVAALVARQLGLPLIEGDEFHPPSNRERMAQGIALTDGDRAGWLDTLAAELVARPQGAVLTCSALKASYRDRLRAAAPGLQFAWLDLDPAAAEARVAQRSTHFFPSTLVATQFAALEPPLDEPRVLRLDALLAAEELAGRVVQWTRNIPASA